MKNFMNVESIFNYKVEINQFLIYSKKSLSKDVKSAIFEFDYIYKDNK